MKRTMKKGLALFTTLCMTAALTACGGGKAADSVSTTGQSTSADRAAGTEDVVHLVMYQLGGKPAHYDQCLEKFNELAMKDLNCTLEVRFIEYGDVPTKYPLIFSSGEEFDLAYAGTWVNFPALAQKGAFMPLEDLLPKYCAESLKLQPEESLEQATIAGHIYAYPTNFYTYSAYGVSTRGDMMKKYGFDELKNFDDLLKFLEVVHENEPEFTNPASMSLTQAFSDIYMEAQGLYPITGGQYGIYYIDSSSGSPKVIAEHEWSGYVEYVEMMKKYADKGLWPQSTLSITDTSSDLYRAGASVAAMCNFDKGVENYQNSDPSWDTRWYNMQPHVNHLAYTQDCVVIPASSKNPERALMLLDKIKTDETYYDLLTYGIEGTDFVREEGGRYTACDPTQFLPEPGTWGYRSQQFYLIAQNAPENYKEMKETLEASVEPNIFRNFNMDIEPVKTEFAAMQTVYAQYNNPLELGFTTDIQKDYQQLKDKADIAGNEKVKAELQRQVDEFYEANKK